VSSYFPTICSQSQLLNRRVRALEPELRELQRGVSETLCRASALYHVLVSPEGVIRAFGMAEAASDERPIGDFLIVEDPMIPIWPTRVSRAFSGSGAGRIDMEHWWRQLPKTTPRERGRKPTVAGLLASGRSIEGVIDQLKDIFALERHRAKTLEGLLARLAAKIAAYTCGQWINERTGRPLRHLADLLV